MKLLCKTCSVSSWENTACSKITVLSLKDATSGFNVDGMEEECCRIIYFNN